MTIRVHKFGGSCIRDPSGLQAIGDILSREPKPLIVTSSASYGVTDIIVDMLNSPLDALDIPGLIQEIRERHHALLGQQVSELPELDNKLQKLERLLYGVMYTGELTSRTKDLIISFGERLIVEVLGFYLDSIGQKTVILQPEDLIRTNGVFEASTVLLEETTALCTNFMMHTPMEGQIYLIPGFFGASKEGIVNLLGRSGTDYTATVLAYAFNAECIMIWKDVSGFMTADPHMVEMARSLESLSYEEATELSHFGAQILHSRSVIPARMKNIPIEIRNIHQWETRTLILNRADLRHNDIIKSVSYIKDLAVIRTYTTLERYNDGVFASISAKLVESGTKILSIATSQTCISFLVSKEQVQSSIHSLEDLKPHLVDEIEYESDFALIGVVGFGLGDTPGIASRVFGTLARIGVNVEIISSGASKAAFHFSIKQKRLKESLETIHREFFPSVSGDA